MPFLGELFRRKSPEQPKAQPTLKEAEEAIVSSFNDPQWGALHKQSFTDFIDVWNALAASMKTGEYTDNVRLSRAESTKRSHEKRNKRYVRALYSVGILVDDYESALNRALSSDGVVLSHAQRRIKLREKLTAIKDKVNGKNSE
jgi:hypothetical protein